VHEDQVDYMASGESGDGGLCFCHHLRMCWLR
jgi:hypothetical protein